MDFIRQNNILLLLNNYLFKINYKIKIFNDF